MSNVLTEIPLVGSGVAVLDGALADLGFSPFVSLTLEFVVLVAVFTVVIKQLARLAPALGRLAVGPMVLLVKAFRLLLLVPQQAVTSVQDRRGRPPGSRVYAYGDGVVRASDRAEVRIRRFPTHLGWSRHIPKKVALLMVVALFVVWNQAYCGAGDRGCVRPIVQWTNAGAAWAKPAPTPAVRHK